MSTPKQENERAPESNGRPPAPGKDSTWKMPPTRIWFWFLGILLLNYLLGRTFYPDPEAPSIVSYNVFKDEVAKGNVTEIYSKGTAITGKFETAVTVPPVNEVPENDSVEVVRTDAKDFVTELPMFIDPGLEKLLLDNDVIIRAQPLQEDVNPVISFLVRFGPALLIILLDRKSTRLNSSHVKISYAVFCLKKKNIVCYSL